MARKKKKKIPIEVDYGKSGREMLQEMGLLNYDTAENIKMPVRKTKEEYDKSNPFKREFIPLTAKEEFAYSVILAQKMLEQFRWLPWMRPFIDKYGNPKIFIKKKSSGRKKITFEDGPVIVKKRKKINL